MRTPSYSNFRSPIQQGSSPRLSGRVALKIGLVNNMSGPAVHVTTKQFSDLLMEAAEGFAVSLKIFAPFAHPRHQIARAARSERYMDAEQLWAAELDGMIVTGTEPKATNLVDEPCWPFLKRLVEWSEENVSSTIWSCLATQAAVYYLDGIARRPFSAKLSGVFDCEKCQAHPILDGYPHRWNAPHSRYNDLPESELIPCGYEILTRSDIAGADIFMKSRKSLHLFLQGHMEYDADVLSREYRRDVRRFLLGESDRYPDLPSGYFSSGSAAALADFRELATRTRRRDLFTDFPKNTDALVSVAPWRKIAVSFYRNWLGGLANKAEKLDQRSSYSTSLNYCRQDPDISEIV